MKQWSMLRKLIFLKLMSGAASILKTVTGTAPITLINAISHAIISITQTGKCAQASTPTPSDPVDIYCNNGKLVARYESGLPTAYKQIESMTMNDNCFYEITDFKLYGSDTLKFSFMATAACNVIGAYSGSADGDNYSLYVTGQVGNYLRYKDGAYRSGINTYTRYDVTISPNGVRGLYFDSDWTPQTFTTSTNLCIGTTALTATSAKLKGTLYGSVEVVGRAKFIPCERKSDNVVGWYDVVSDTFYAPVSGSTNPTRGEYVDEQVVVMVKGTDEVITLSASGAEDQTASVADLLGIGTDGDTQEIISGHVTRKYGVYVLTGDEEWYRAYYSSGSTHAVFRTPLPGSLRQEGRTPVPCTHFVGTDEANASMPENSIKLSYIASDETQGYLFINAPVVQTTDMTALVKAQFNAGTPVIIVYPLATPTTESVAAQPLHTAAGTNTVSVSAEVSGISLSCEYRGTE